MQAASGRRPFFEFFGTDYDTPDRTCLRDFVHVLDIAQAHLLGMRRIGEPGFRAYNIGTGKSYSVKEVHEAAEKVTGRTIKIRFAPRRNGDPPVLCADPRQLMNEFGWTPKYSSLENILAGAWDWEQQQCKQLVVEGPKKSGQLVK